MFVFGNDVIDVAIWIIELHIAFMLLIDSCNLNSPRGVPIENLNVFPEALSSPDKLLSSYDSIVAIQVRHDQLFQWLGASRNHNYFLVLEVWRV